MAGDFRTSEPWRVGVLFSCTGVTAVIEESQLKGTLLAIEEINAAGGVNGREIMPVIYDPGSDPQGFVRYCHRLLAEDRVKVASGELMQVISEKFDDWRLSPSERDIAVLLIKGLSNQEIAEIRATRPGTVKSQSSSIYQKSGVKNRHELAAYFVEDLLAGERLLPREAVAP